MRLVVVSTGFNARTKQMCIGSVARQRIPDGVTLEHRYIEASTQNPPRTWTENVRDAVSGLAPDDIVLSVDGDDWLAHDRVAEVVSLHYANPDVWLTYGSYAHADGRPGICRAYDDEDYRGSQWRASHLKTFRAALFQKIREEDLRDARGAWLALAVDHAIMFPMLEMATRAHTRYIKDVLYTYNFVSSYEHNADTAGIEEERRTAAWLRAKPRYSALGSL